ncbi:MAG TPA: 50S ribosomal protein L31 [Flexistipes sinusarabici]|uniref:Large ribosomal subunit protein bL31 n=1 Tax=Flexistipes sinusarabici TaxID=2352 RepID=A0A3D5QCT6_FLESI|nr:50S ribosomal protein L31 [Flexistipes sinusarabici]
MKKGIHPEYKDAVIKCACGNEIHTKSPPGDPWVAFSPACHPFFTGRQKFVDTAGRVEKFMKKYGDYGKKNQKKKSK